MNNLPYEESIHSQQKDGSIILYRKYTGYEKSFAGKFNNVYDTRLEPQEECWYTVKPNQISVAENKIGVALILRSKSGFLYEWWLDGCVAMTLSYNFYESNSVYFTRESKVDKEITLNWIYSFNKGTHLK